MRFEIAQKLIPSEIFKELGFAEYLNLFANSINLYSQYILHPLSREQAIAHYAALEQLQKQLDDKKLEALLEECAKLPQLEVLLSFFKTQNLETFHLFTLGTYLRGERKLLSLELRAEGLEIIEKIEAVLRQYLNVEFSNFAFTDEELQQKKKAGEIEQLFSRAMNIYENEICNKTNLKLIYPHLREVTAAEAEKFNTHPVKELKLVKKEDKFYFDFVLPENLEDLKRQQENIRSLISDSIKSRLQKLNHCLGAYYNDLVLIYEKRKANVFLYSLLQTQRRQNLVFPHLTDELKVELVSGRLPCLQKQNSEHYIPLKMTLEKGSSLLFGANMTGKTTVLKTLYFHLILVKLGLPIPAQSLSLKFPQEVALYLKSSGSLAKHLSSYGEELDFFSHEFADESVVLVDELFQSTDPVSGPVLSKIFLQEYGQRDVIFFCSTHYSEVLTEARSYLYKMKDIDWQMGDSLSLETLMSQIPYEVERIDEDKVQGVLQNNLKPFYIALHFPLKEKIKHELKMYIEQAKRK